MPASGLSKSQLNAYYWKPSKVTSPVFNALLQRSCLKIMVPGLPVVSSSTSVRRGSHSVQEQFRKLLVEIVETFFLGMFLGVIAISSYIGFIGGIGIHQCHFRNLRI